MTAPPARLGALLDAALGAVDPVDAVVRALCGDVAHEALDRRARVMHVVGAGKALRGMLHGLALALPEVELRGIGIEKPDPSSRGRGWAPPPGVEILPGDHPIPGPRSFDSSQRLVDAVRRWPPAAPCVALISGGASALLSLPAAADRAALVELTRNDLGLPIAELNRRRARLDPLKGGGLARLVGPRPFHGLVISDVPTATDPLGTVGSGPTVLPDNRDRHVIVASNGTAVRAALAAARSSGALAFQESVDGEASDEGRRLAGRLLTLARAHPNDRVVLVAGGESTVRVRGSGLGGRNQELALGAAQVLAETPACLLSLGTDGEDGPTDAAGAWVDGSTARTAGTRLNAALDNNDAYPLLAQLDRLIRLGRTGTNVADVVIGISMP